MELQKIISELSQHEKKVLLTLEKLGGKSTPAEILQHGDFTKQVAVMNATSWLQSKKLVTVEEHISKTYVLGKEGKQFLQQGFPEKRALRVIADHSGSATFSQIGKALDKSEISVAIGWLKRYGWVTISKDKDTVFNLTDKGKKALSKTTPEEQVLKNIDAEAFDQLNIPALHNVLSRKNVVKEKERISSTITLTDLGKNVVKEGLELREELTQLTSESIKNRKWEEMSIRPYDIHAFAPNIYGGKPHPLVYLIDEIRQIFLEMGFEEIEGHYVESGFWNMDALFIPQDHPAREMQDTLYCSHPAKMPIKETKFVEKIAEVHESGGSTGSSGWGYSFSREEGKRTLLRTHTTVNTLRYLYHNPKPPCKVFSVGRVFRKENIDTTHLPEFYQIEGIVHEEGANFRQLLGLLKEFYHRMGFEKIRFRPGYFPYTEPSMEVEVFWNDRWMELGGSGIFRPEVTQPVGVTEPVLAWGLGLERLAMLRYDLTDMRALYTSDLAWLRKQPLI